MTVSFTIPQKGDRTSAKLNFALALLALLTCMLSSVACADPAAPSGWAHRQESRFSIYHNNARSDIELRLYPAIQDPIPLQPWLEARLARGSADLGAVKFGEVQQNDPKTFMALGTAGSGRIVVALVCARSDDAKRYAELVLPQDPALIQTHLPSAAQVLGQACLEQAGSGAAAAPIVAAPSKTNTANNAPAPAPTSPLKSTPTGKGLRDADIAGVLYSWNQVYQVTGLQMMEWTYLLLVDGSAREGVPDVSIDAFDLAADKRAHPELWGRWQRHGAVTQVDFGEGFTEPPNQMARVKGQKGERLHNRYRGSASANIGTTSSWASWGLALNRNGTFKRWSTQGTGGTMLGTSALVVGDDKGSSSVVSAPGAFGGGGSKSTGVTDADLEGEYTIDGWTLELRYRSGKVQRGFFYRSSEGTDIWFEGNELYVLKGE